GVNTCTDSSSLKSMLPTACFSMGNSRSPTGSTLTDASWESERLTLSAAGGSPPPWFADRAESAACALASPFGEPNRDSSQSAEYPNKWPITAATRITAAAANTTDVLLLADRIGRTASKSPQT